MPTNRSNGLGCSPPIPTPCGPSAQVLVSGPPAQSTAVYCTMPSLPLATGWPLPGASTRSFGPLGGVVPLATEIFGSAPLALDRRQVPGQVGDRGVDSGCGVLP